MNSRMNRGLIGKVIGPGLFLWAIAASPALANCAQGGPGSVEWNEPAMSRHFQQIQSETDYPWGETRLYDRIEGDRIFLTDAFASLNGAERRQAIDTLINFDSRTYLSETEYEEKFRLPDGRIGPLPHDVVAGDGRLVSAAYDACTRGTLLTEFARFGWYYNQAIADATPLTLRNVDSPSWRQVNFPIEPAEEKAIRLGFWNSVGYDSPYGWWIAWVPEQGNFEVNVPEGFDYDKLQRYWQVANRDYDYVVVRSDGTQLGVKRF